MNKMIKEYIVGIGLDAAKNFLIDSVDAKTMECRLEQ